METIQLSGKYWLLFLAFVGEKSPDKYDAARTMGAMEFRNVTIKKGSAFQVENLVPILRKEVRSDA